MTKDFLYAFSYTSNEDEVLNIMKNNSKVDSTIWNIISKSIEFVELKYKYEISLTFDQLDNNFNNENDYIYLRYKKK